MIAFTTSQVDEVRRLREQWESAATGMAKARRVLLLADPASGRAGSGEGRPMGAHHGQ
jgi:hypothetical protein